MFEVFLRFVVTQCAGVRLLGARVPPEAMHTWESQSQVIQRKVQSLSRDIQC